MKKILGIVAILTLVLMSFIDADFHSSMTKVDYNESSGVLKFTTKLNSADIADAIKIDPNTTAFDAAVKKYVEENFDVAVNGSNQNLTFTASHVSGETVWVYFETGNVGNINSLRIKNTILFQTFPKQLNSVNIVYKNVQKTMSFVRGKEVNEVNF